MSDAKDLAGVKVMVIDDSNTIRRSVEIFLAQSGCEIILVMDGFDAMVKIVDGHPDVIFIDSMMPRLPRWLSDLRVNQEQPPFSIYPNHHAVEQGRLV